MYIGLLEDDIAIQEMLLILLQDEGYTVTTYHNAEECLEVLGVATQPQPLDLLIIDWRLGGSISGIEVIRQIRNQRAFHSLPIILTTAAIVRDSEELQKVQNLNIALLEKPFAIEAMISLVGSLVLEHSPVESQPTFENELG